MQPQLDALRNVFRYKIIYHVMVIYVCALFLIAGISYISFRLYNTWSELSDLNAEVDTFKSTVDFIKNNRDLVAAHIDDYNRTLEQLIPDEESYFSVISALEKMSSETGVIIKSYTIDLEATSMSKLSLRVEVTGPAEALQKLLENSTFVGGRLITIEKVDLVNTEEGTSMFLFNFYHGQYTVGTSVPQEKLTQKDIQILEDIRGKLN